MLFYAQRVHVLGTKYIATHSCSNLNICLPILKPEIMIYLVVSLATL
jgi:hypothetical protein